MIAPVFVDTNVLIYALDEADLKKQQAARVWRAELWKSRRGRISFQVGSSNWWELRVRSSIDPHSCWRTNLPGTCIPLRRRRSWNYFAN